LTDVHIGVKSTYLLQAIPVIHGQPVASTTTAWWKRQPHLNVVESSFERKFYNGASDYRQALGMP
jgi:hypothetical protein